MEKGRKMDESEFVIHSSAPQTLGIRALRRCLNFGVFWLVRLLLVLLLVADFVAFPRLLCDKIFEYVIHSCLSGWSAFEVFDSGSPPRPFFPVFWELVLCLQVLALELSRRMKSSCFFTAVSDR
jgi:hypothetical protein